VPPKKYKSAANKKLEAKKTADQDKTQGKEGDN
jgi:hypothetical protein